MNKNNSPSWAYGRNPPSPSATFTVLQYSGEHEKIKCYLFHWQCHHERKQIGLNENKHFFSLTVTAERCIHFLGTKVEMQSITQQSRVSPQYLGVWTQYSFRHSTPTPTVSCSNRGYSILLERVQRKFTRMLPGLDGPSYWERLTRLRLYSLEPKRKRGDLRSV